MRVVDAIDERGAREAAEDNRMGRADARACQHRDRQFRNQRHVQRDTIAFDYAKSLQDIRKATNFRVQLLIGEGARVTRLAFPNQRSFVPSPRRQMAIETVVTDIDLSADEPFGMGCFPL